MPALIALEQSIVIYANQLALTSGFLLNSTRFFAVWAIFFIVAFFAASVFIDWNFIRISSKLFVIQGVLAVGVSWVFNQLIALVYLRERPYMALEKVQTVIGETVTSKSFPSDHTTISFALALTIFLWSPKIGVWFLLLALLIGIARVFAGVHYPTDILGGIIVGVVFGWIMHRLIS